MDTSIQHYVPQKVTCLTCGGRGVAIFACCTGEVIHSDYDLCPECKEHCGEEKCEDCDGTGMVYDDDTPLTPVAPDMQLKAEIYFESKKYGDE